MSRGGFLPDLLMTFNIITASGIAANKLTHPRRVSSTCLCQDCRQHPHKGNIENPRTSSLWTAHVLTNASRFVSVTFTLSKSDLPQKRSCAHMERSMCRYKGPFILLDGPNTLRGRRNDQRFQAGSVASTSPFKFPVYGRNSMEQFRIHTRCKSLLQATTKTRVVHRRQLVCVLSFSLQNLRSQLWFVRPFQQSKRTGLANCERRFGDEYLNSRDCHGHEMTSIVCLNFQDISRENSLSIEVIECP